MSMVSGGPCDFSVSPSPMGLHLGLLTTILCMFCGLIFYCMYPNL